MFLQMSILRVAGRSCIYRCRRWAKTSPHLPGDPVDKACHVCIYTTENGEAAMELTARMLGMTTGRTINRRSGQPVTIMGNKSALVKTMTAAALEAAMLKCTDPDMVAEAKELLDHLSCEVPGTETKPPRYLATYVVRKIPARVHGGTQPKFVGMDGQPLPKVRYEPDPKNPGYERRVK